MYTFTYGNTDMHIVYMCIIYVFTVIRLKMCLCAHVSVCTCMYTSVCVFCMYVKVMCVCTAMHVGMSSYMCVCSCVCECALHN